MFYRIQNDKIYDYADYDYVSGCIYTDLCDMQEYINHPGKYIVADVPVSEGEGEVVTEKRLIINPNYEDEQAAKREADFNKAFFNTSLGYIRRSVTMADGSKKDFLSDLLLSIKAGLEQGLNVKILAYDKPPFDEDVTDWTEYQKQEVVTPQFIQECLLQLSADFGAINTES